jgi:hypothetical protein
VDKKTMADMLVRLYSLPDAALDLAGLNTQSIFIRQGQPGEKRVITEWVRQHFQDSWVVERVFEFLGEAEEVPEAVNPIYIGFFRAVGVIPQGDATRCLRRMASRTRSASSVQGFWEEAERLRSVARYCFLHKYVNFEQSKYR